MDQVKQLLAVLKKYHFWILSVLVAIVACAGWYFAVHDLSSAFAANSTKLNGYQTQLGAIKNKESHPNERVNEGIKKQATAQSQRVSEVWQKLYEHQKQHVLYWPEKLTKLRRMVERLPFGAEIQAICRSDYQAHVRDEFRKFPEIVRASRQSVRKFDADTTLGQPRRVEAHTETQHEDYLVHWDDYGDIGNALEPVWKVRPSSPLVWITQENLWVYRTLLEIIKKTNAEATGPHDALVKRIIQLQVGRDAALENVMKDRIFMPAQGPDGQALAAGGDAQGRGGAVEETADPADRLIDSRYLGDQRQPIAGNPVKDGSLGVLKRLPIRMVLEMDQRELPRLIAECANAPLPVEITQVRINVGSGDAAQLRKRKPRSPGAESGRSDGEPVPDPAIVPVIFHGIIFIFNKPENDKLGIEPATEARQRQAAVGSLAGGVRTHHEG